MQGFKLLIFCVLFACLTTALQAYSKRNVDMKQTRNNVSLQNKLHFQQDYLGLNDGSTAQN
jgi:hypothetical protein